MASLCFYFHVHQPYRIKYYSVFDIGTDSKYFDDDSEKDVNNKRLFNRISDKCYLPTNALMLKLLKKHPEFKIAYSITGTFLEQAEEFRPEVIESFKKLVDTGRVEIIAETYYHSLAYLYSVNEFKEQVLEHEQKIQDLFGVKPKVFRNTELIYNNSLAQTIEDMGYKGILTEGADHILGWRSPNFLYKPTGTKNIKLLLKNYRLSDDIAFRFSNKGWEEHPLSTKKFVSWINEVNGNGEIVNLFMDYETFGEHQWEDTGIFEFLEHLPTEFLKHKDNDFVTPSEAIDKLEARHEVDIPDFISWADMERDLSAWRSNKMQHDALEKVYSLETLVKKHADSEMLRDWKMLQTSDHFYFMCTKWFNDGDVHKYFNAYESPYEAFIAYMNVLEDFRIKLLHKRKAHSKNTLRKIGAYRKAFNA